ncbi:MAG: hypothetical protein AAF558_05365 [Verrucomicrobiota bacterium]
MNPLAKILSWAGIVGLTCLAGCNSPSTQSESLTQRELQNIHTLVESRQTQQALLAFRKGASRASERGDVDLWLSQWLELAVERKSTPDLLQLYSKDPELILNHELASYYLARIFAASNDSESYKSITEAWNQRENLACPELWQFLKSDELVKVGNDSDAVALLEASSFEGTAESNRLLRLAFIHSQQPEIAFDYLSRAYAADPRNPDVRLARASVLENKGEIQWANVEYVAAMLADPNNPFVRLELSKFYVRNGIFGKAIQTLADTPEDQAYDFMLLPLAFWTKVVGSSISTTIPKPSERGQWNQLVASIQQLPQGTFWNETLFRETLATNGRAENREEVFWLKTIQQLKEGDEASARLLMGSKSTSKLNQQPELLAMLQIIANYRIEGILPDVSSFPAIDSDPDSRHSLLSSFLEWSNTAKSTPELPAMIDEIIGLKSAYGAAFLACGWTRAGLALIDYSEVSEIPEWLHYAVARSIQIDQDEKQALAYLEKAPKAPLTDLVRGELLFLLGRPEEAKPLLHPLLTGENEQLAFRSSWILSNFFIEMNDYKAAMTVLQQCPSFAASTQGKLVLAQVQANAGELEQAEENYRSVASDSLEAKMFLSRLAFSEKRWEEAKEWTEQLVEQAPEEMSFRLNMNQIQMASQDR